ncbi:MAG: FtsW/RodA/SpoVE family cell cycle protein [Phycisphaeraceae bacterium]
MLQRLSNIFTFHPGWLALLAALGLTGIGITAIATVPHEVDYAARQGQWLAIALLVMLPFAFPHPKLIGDASYPLLVVTILLLVFVILPGMPESVVPVRNGIRAWIDLKFMLFQPSELAKIAFILALAWYLRHRSSYRTLTGLLVPFAIMFLPVLLILRQPDLGSAVLFAPVLFAMLVAAGARMRHMATLAVLASLSVAYVFLSILFDAYIPAWMQVLKGYQRDRIRAMLDLVQDGTLYITDQAYQQYKAMTLIGSGQGTGLGAERSATIIRFNWLPEAHNDMIFAVIVNRWGWSGAMIVLSLFVLLIGSLLLIAVRSKDPFARLVVVGFAALLFTQMTINIGMAIGLLPVIGITLPFVSYGGSSLLTAFMMIGLAFNFASARASIIHQPSFEYDYADLAA